MRQLNEMLYLIIKVGDGVLLAVIIVALESDFQFVRCQCKLYQVLFWSSVWFHNFNSFIDFTFSGRSLRKRPTRDLYAYKT